MIENRLQRGLLSKQLLVEWYGEELSQKPKGVSILRNAYKVMLDCNLLIGNYKMQWYVNKTSIYWR